MRIGNTSSTKGGNILAQVKSKQRVTDFGEVFTSEKTVNEMLDALPEEMFAIDKSFLEPTCGEGVFILEILKRKFANCKNRKAYTIALGSVYGMELQEDNVKICIGNIINLCSEYFKPTKQEIELINNHIIQADSLKVMAMLNDNNLYQKEYENE